MKIIGKSSDEKKIKREKKRITDLYRILFNGGHQVDDGSSNNDLSIKWEIKKRAFPNNFFFFLLPDALNIRFKTSKFMRKKKKEEI